MRHGKRFIGMLLPSLLCLVSLLVSACGGSSGGNSTSNSGTKAPANQQIYRWAFRLPDINTFDPGISTDATSINAINMVFTGLVQLDDNLNIQPQMAQSYDKSTDGLTYTFHLRQGLKFSDGKTLDANDVAYSIDRALSPDINNQSGVALTYLGLIKGAADRTAGKVKTVIGSGLIIQDPNTLVIHITQPAAYFLGALSYPTSYVVEKSVVTQWGQKWTDHLSDNGGQGGDGPFMVKEYNHNTGIKLVPNPNYYGPKPQLSEVDYLPYKDRATSYNAYLAGQADYSAIPLAEFTQAKQNPEFHQVPALTIFYIGMNYLVKPLDNIHIRQALAIALNRDVIVKAAWHSAYIPTCHIVPQGMYGYNSNLTCPAGTPVTGDAAKAKQLFQQGLQEEGMTASSFPTVTYTYPTNSPETANEVTTEVQMWKTVLGVTIATTAISQNTMYTLETQTTGKNGPLQMWAGGWGADYPDPQDWITLQFGDNQPYNEFNFGNNNGSTAAQQRDLQKQMDAADTVSDPAARAQTYNKIEQQLLDYVAWLPIYQRPELYMLKPYVAGFKENSQAQIPPNDWANIYITTH
jgi:oligopeptide transport system substrate-binding protein